MADKILKSLNFGGADNYFPLPLVTAADNDKILSVVNGEWAAVEAPSSGPSSGQYVWSKQFAGSTPVEDTDGVSKRLTIVNINKPSREIEYSASAPVYNSETKKWEMADSTIVTLTNADTTVPSFSGNTYVRLTSAPNVWYLTTAINVAGSGPYIKTFVYNTKYTADIDSSYVEYVTGDTETDYPDGGWSDGAYYKLFTTSFVAGGISDWVAIEQSLGVDIKRIRHANDILVAGAASSSGGLYYSTDGKTWTQSNITDKGINDIRFDNNIWVAAISSSGLYYSTDGKTWTQSNITDKSFYSVYYGGGIWVAASNNSTGGGLYYSTDGRTWTQSNITDKSCYEIYYGNNSWVAITASYGLYYSTDGKTWTQSNITNKSFNSVYYGGGIWVAASNDYGLYYSTDGKAWTQSNITNKTGYGIYYGNNIFVACTGGGLYYSTDGRTWTQSNITDKSFRSIRYGDGIWVASSYSYGLYYSTDGKTWTPSNISSEWIYCIDYHNGLWLAGTTTTINSILFSSILDVGIELKNY